MVQHYGVTTDGMPINYPQLVAAIASHPSIFAVLVHEHAAEMSLKAKLEIKASHLHADAKGKQAFMEDGLSHVDGQTSLCYWPYDKVKELCDEIKEVRKLK